MRRTLILIAAVLFSVLTAQKASAQASPPPSCWPEKFGPLHIGGTGSEVITGYTIDLGVWWAWKCPDGSTAFKAALEVWKGGPTLAELASRFRAAESVFAGLTELWRVYDTPLAACTDADPCDPGWLNLAASATEAAQQLPTPGVPPPPPTPPPPGAWVTSGLSTYNTANGALAGYVGSASAKGLPCDCTKPIKVGAMVYCTFAGAPGPHVVAACKQAPPPAPKAARK